MTRRDYLTLSRALAAAQQRERIDGAYIHLRYVVAIATAIKRENAAFDVGRFLDDAGVVMPTVDSFGRALLG